jgi:hypothetical protein
MCPSLLNCAEEWLNEHFPAAMNIDAIIELLDVKFSTWSVSYQILDVYGKESRRLVLRRASCLKKM